MNPFAGVLEILAHMLGVIDACEAMAQDRDAARRPQASPPVEVR